MERINYEVLKVGEKISNHNAERYVQDYYSRRGYLVFRGNIDGYRCIGVEHFWKDYIDRLTKKQMEMISLIKKLVSKREFYLLSKMIVNKKGCPDLMLIKDRKIEFVEVKSGKDHLLPEQIEFMLSCKYPCKVVHICHHQEVTTLRSPKTKHL